MYDKFTAEKCFDKIDFLFQKYGLIPARSIPANPALPTPRSAFGERGDVAGAANSHIMSSSLAVSGIVEQSLIYNDGSDSLTGMLFYQQMDGSARRPGLVLYGGPWGDGGGAAEREYARV